MDAEAIVIGAGLFGATIARALRNQGRSVIVLDDERPMSGSAPSGSLMKPSWFSSMGKDVYDPALALMEEIYGIQDIKFRLRPSGVHSNVHWVPTSKILDREELAQGSCRLINRDVEEVRPGVVGTTNGDEFTSPLIIVAAGIWSKYLIHVPQLVGKQGISFRVPAQIEENFIQPWAPYKQSVAFQETPDSIWAGDGSAILRANWTAEREDKSVKRMSKITKLDNLDRSTGIVGIRPYVPKMKPCLLEEREPGLWIATGGAKNGMIAAGWCAAQILEKTS